MPEVHWCLGGRGQRWQLAGVWVLTQAGVGEAAANWDEAVSSTALHASLSSSLSLLQGIFPTQGSNPGLPHCSQILYQLSQEGKKAIYLEMEKQMIGK